MDLKEQGVLAEDPNHHWYYRSKRAAVNHLLDGLHIRSLLDVGAGDGFFARSFLEHGKVDEATCVDPGYSEDRDETVVGRRLRFRRSPDSVDADLILMMDVLEHVDDDVGLVHEYVARAQVGTQFLVTVPAFKWLWSGHDVFLGHRRRYTLQQVEQVLRDGGLTVERGCYFYSFVLPAAAVMRLASRIWGSNSQPRSHMRGQGRVVDTALWVLCHLELGLLKANRAGGLSAIVLARKGEQPAPGVLLIHQ